MTCTGTLIGGKSAVCMLNSVVDRTPPFGTPVLNERCMDVSFLYVV